MSRRPLVGAPAVVAALLVLVAAGSAAAHPISVTKAFAFVTRDSVNVKLEIFVEDLYLFHNLQPNERDFLEPAVIRDGIAKHREFLLERFVIRDVRGERLASKVVGVQEFEMPADGVPLAELMQHTLTFELHYRLADPPEFLTFSQHLVDQEILVPAEMQLLIKQENAGSPFEALLMPDEPQTVRFSWDNPPLDAEASQAEWDAWFAKQREETLGITSYSSVYAFLYIDDHQVRLEILVPLLTLEESVPITRADDAFLEVAEQQAARQQIADFFMAGNPLEIDGQLVSPTVERIDFYGLDFKDFAQRAERRRVSMANARAGIILSYDTRQPPSTLKLTWDRFNKYIWSVNLIVYAYEDTLRATVSRIGDANVFQWNGSGRPAAEPVGPVEVNLPPPPRWSVPVVSLASFAALALIALAFWRWQLAARWLAFAALVLIAIGAACWPLARVSIANPLAPTPRPDASQADAIFATLQKNVYRAFDFRDESQIYDALAQSVDGKLLHELYLKIRRGLEMQEQGGAVSRVAQVDIQDGRPMPLEDGQAVDPRGFGYRCRWTVTGTVEHWGHVHSRTNQYEAAFAIEPREGLWKITEMAVLDEQRLEFDTRLRGL